MLKDQITYSILNFANKKPHVPRTMQKSRKRPRTKILKEDNNLKKKGGHW